MQAAGPRQSQAPEPRSRGAAERQPSCSTVGAGGVGFDKLGSEMAYELPREVGVEDLWVAFGVWPLGQNASASERPQPARPPVKP